MTAVTNFWAYLLRVDPKLIRFFLDFGTPRPGELRSARRDVNKRRISGIVVDDRLITRGAALETCPHVAALKERFVHGKTWEETGYIELFESWYKRINKGKYADCSWDDFKAHRLLDWDDVFQDIREHEYRPAKRPVDNVEVAISDKGEILAVDGRHRLYFAQILGIQSIPIIVNLIAASMVERAQSVTELEKILSR